MTHFLFPDNDPPPFPNDADVPTALVWLLAVLDRGDSARRFVASLLACHHDRGFLTERQMQALRTIAAKAIRRHADGALECQGGQPTSKQTLAFGEVVDFVAARADARGVLE